MFYYQQSGLTLAVLMGRIGFFFPFFFNVWLQLLASEKLNVEKLD